MTDHATCETCRFWMGRVRGRVYSPGQCRRYPPPSVDQGNPVTTIDFWCGEHQPKEAQP